jgi:Transglycosylase
MRDYQADIGRADNLSQKPYFAHCPKSASDAAGDRAGRGFAALPSDAALSHRPPGLRVNGLALYEGCPGIAAVGRPRHEDAKFCSHRGVDWGALREVIDDAEDGEVSRGGSTITQQVAKNLFLWPGRSVVRKGLELPLALWIDFVLPKARILEIYLNIAELGPGGQFGAQTGSLYAFGHGASMLTAREAALLAAILPNPHVRSARNPAPGVRRLAGIYVARAQAQELQRCWGGF